MVSNDAMFFFLWKIEVSINLYLNKIKVKKTIQNIFDPIIYGCPLTPTLTLDTFKARLFAFCVDYGFVTLKKNQ